MKWYLNLKIGVKLIIGFILVAVIAGGIGVVGYISTNILAGHLHEVADVRLPSVNSLLMISESQTAVRAGLRNLNNPDIDVEQKKSDYKYIEDALARSEKYWAIYEPLPQSAEEAIEWDKFVSLWNAWRVTVDKTVEASKNYDEAVQNNAPNQAALLSELHSLNGESAAAFLPAEESLLKVDEINLDLAEEANVASDEAVTTAVTLIVIISALGVAISIILGLYISSIIKKPINKMVVAAEKIADGDLNVDIQIDTKDEIGILANAFRRMAENVNEVMTDINSAAEQVSAGSGQVADSSQQLSQGATEQASSVEEITASMEELSAQTNQNAANAGEANNITNQSKADAEQGNNRMKEMLVSMDEINESSRNISKIIKVIDEIAFQTNILALNAAVEAARAGQHGKGFAVVAEEVRNLAARSAKAAKETTEMIEGSIAKAGTGTDIAKETAKALENIVSGVTDAARLVSEIADASNEQASGIEQVNEAIMQVSQVTQTNSATSEEAAAASEELSSQAQLLKDAVNRFKLKHANQRGRNNFDSQSRDMMKMLDEGEDFEEPQPKKAQKKLGSGKKKISLDDQEFGKY